MSDTAKDTRELVKRLAVDAFKDHQLTLVRPGLWKCARPDRWVYGFYVATMPGAIVTYGDTPDALLRVYGATDETAIEWLRGAVNSPDYLLEKATARAAWREFYPADAVRAAKELARDSKRLKPFLADVLDEHQRGDLHQYRWCELASEYSVDDAYDTGTGWSASAWWVVEGFRTFMRLHDAHVAPVTEGAA